MKTYEITYITVAEEGYDAASISEALATNGAKIVSVHPWGARRRLAYPIKKQDQAFYTTVVFDAETSALKAIDRALSLNNDVLRHLIVEFEPGMFQRAQNQPTAEAQSAKEEPKAEEATAETVTEPVATEEVAEEVAEENAEEPAVIEEASTDTEEETSKSKRTTKKSDEEQKELDEKIDALLNEDIA